MSTFLHCVFSHNKSLWIILVLLFLNNRVQDPHHNSSVSRTKFRHLFVNFVTNITTCITFTWSIYTLSLYLTAMSFWSSEVPSMPPFPILPSDRLSLGWFISRSMHELKRKVHQCYLEEENNSHILIFNKHTIERTFENVVIFWWKQQQMLLTLLLFV